MNRTRKRTMLAAGTAIAVIAVVGLTAPWLVHHTIETTGSAALGRDVRVDRVALQWLPRPAVDIAGLQVGHPAWVEGGTALFTAQQATIELRPLRSLSRRMLVVRRLTLEAPVIEARRRRDGSANWTFGGDGQAPDGQAPFAVEALGIEAGTFSWRDAAADLDVNGRFDSRIEPGDSAPLSLTMTGTYRGKDLRASLTGGSPLGLRDKAVPFPLRASLSSGATHVTLDGHVLRPLELERFELDAEFTGPNPADLYPLIPLPIPDLPPYNVRARVAYDPSGITVQDLEGTFGDSDVNGYFHVRVTPPGGEARPRVTGRARSRVLDFDDIAGLIGAPPGTAPGETANEQQRREARASDNDERLLPRTAVDFRRLRVADVELDYRAEHVRLPRLPVDGLRAELRLLDGRLELAPLQFQLAGGELEFRIVADARGDTLDAAVEGTLSRIALRELLAGFGVTHEAAGTLGGSLDLAGRGNSLAAVAATLSGEALLSQGGGRIDNVLVELLGLDLGEALVAWLASPERIDIRCAVVDLQAREGVVRAQRLFVDTSDTLFHGDARIDLAREHLAMRFDAAPKDTSILSGDAPLYVHGAFTDLEAGTNVGEAVLSMLTPVELGENAVQTDCVTHVAATASNP